MSREAPPFCSRRSRARRCRTCTRERRLRSCRGYTLLTLKGCSTALGTGLVVCTAIGLLSTNVGTLQVQLPPVPCHYERWRLRVVAVLDDQGVEGGVGEVGLVQRAGELGRGVGLDIAERAEEGHGGRAQASAEGCRGATLFSSPTYNDEAVSFDIELP